MRSMRPVALLAAIWCLFAGVTVLWLLLDRQPPAWDDSWYLTESMVVYDALWDGGVPGLVRAFHTVLGFKAPLITALPVPFYLLLGRDWHVAFLVNLVAMGVLFCAVYAIGKRCANEWVGLTAVVILGTMPLMYGLARWYLVEYALTAMVALLFWLLLLSPRLESRLVRVAAGVFVGFGLLMKASFPLFAAGPLAVAFLRCTNRRNAALDIGLPSLLIAGPWYATHWWATWNNAIAAGFGETTTQAQGTGAILSLTAIGRYLQNSARDGLSWYYTFLLLAAAIIVAVRRPNSVLAVCRCMLPWLAPLAVFLFAGNKDLRYAAPLYPALAIGLAAFVDWIAGGRKWALAVATVIPFACLVATSFQWPFAGQGHVYARRYQPQPWPLRDIVTAMGRSAGGGAAQPVLLVGTDRAAFNANNIDLTSRQMRVPLFVQTAAYEKDALAVRQAARRASFVTFKEGGEAESPFFNRFAGDLIGYVRGSGEFEQIYKSPPLPDGGIAFLFRRRREAAYVPSGVAGIPSLRADFGGMVELAGLAVKRSQRILEVKYEWRSIKPVDREYWCFTHIVDESNKVIGFLDHRPLQGDPAITDWLPGDVALETLRTEPGGMSGPIKLRIGLYHVASGERLRVTSSGNRFSIVDDGTALELTP